MSIPILVILLNFTLNAQWEIINEGFKDFINSMYFQDDKTGWLAGNSGALYYTEDGGENWSDISVSENWDISQIHFMNDSVGWAVGSIRNETGDFGIIIKSTDGGSNWDVKMKKEGFTFNHINVIDQNNYFVIGDDKIFKTSDGGINWSDVSPTLPDQTFRNYNSLWFQNSDTGVVVGRYYNTNTEISCAIILKTTDGGMNWSENYVTQYNNISDIQFYDKNTGYFKCYNDSLSFLCRTDDLFSNWSVFMESYSEIISYQCLDKNTIYTIVFDSLSSVLNSTDGGNNWGKIYSCNNTLDKIHFNDSASGIILGRFFSATWGTPQQFVLKNANDEASWTMNNFTCSINDVFFLDEENGYVVGGVSVPSRSHSYSKGIIFRTNNGGKVWDDIFKFGNMASGCSFPNHNIGYILSSGKLYTTIDQGENWSILYEDSSESIFRGGDISFHNQENGWMVGNYMIDGENRANIWGTHDGGINWDLVWQHNEDSYLNSICAVDTSAWAVGENGMIVKYTPNNGWYLMPKKLDNLSLNTVYFFDEDKGWISGSGRFSHTVDGGENWEKISGVTYIINDINFINSEIGFAVGGGNNKGIILKTIDGGYSWDIEIDGLMGPLNAIFIRDNFAWAVGEFGLILKLSDIATTLIDENNTIIDSKLKLSQNYPNPFNPSTTIKYSIPKQSNVTLKVFDVLGSEVKILVKKEQPLGHYEVEFDGSELTSGIYYYRLRADDFVETKKMILLK